MQRSRVKFLSPRGFREPLHRSVRGGHALPSPEGRIKALVPPCCWREAQWKEERVEEIGKQMKEKEKERET